MLFQHDIAKDLFAIYGSTMPFGFGAVYKAYHSEEDITDPMDVFMLYIPETTNQQVATATWALPVVATTITPGALSVVPPVVPMVAAAVAAELTWLDLIGDALADAAKNMFSGYQAYR